MPAEMEAHDGVILCGNCAAEVGIFVFLYHYHSAFRNLHRALLEFQLELGKLLRVFEKGGARIDRFNQIMSDARERGMSMLRNPIINKLIHRRGELSTSYPQVIHRLDIVDEDVD